MYQIQRGDYKAYESLLIANELGLPTMECLVPASEIIPRLFLGNIYDAYYLERRQNLTQPMYVLNIAATHPFLQHTYPGIIYLNIRNVKDGPNTIAPYFLPAIRFIEKALANPQAVILVHCLAGMVRSATLVVAYMIYRDFVDNILHANVQQSSDTQRDAYIVKLKGYSSQSSSSEDEKISAFVKTIIRQISKKRTIINIRPNFIEDLNAFTKALLSTDPHISPLMLDARLLMMGFNHPRLQWQTFATNSSCTIM